MTKYDPKKIEAKWQKHWEKEKTFSVKEDPKKKKWYSLIEFPYPSGEGLHVGHPRPFTAMDVISRKRRMEGYNVLYPIGFDAFGLPTENFAIKTKQPPAVVTKKNIANFTRQLKALGYSFDWERAVDTTDPKYFKWTQWLFLQFFKHGLAYKKNQPINWCPKDKIGLANEEVVNGCCERCGTAVEQRNKEQWMLAITKYAEKLLQGLKDVDYITPARVSQENWIGKSEGALVKFQIPNSKFQTLEVFTTRPDTLFGVTFMAISAELAKSWVEKGWETSKEVKDYISKTLSEQKVLDREEKEKTGIKTGMTAINPVNGKNVPIWITNYVLGGVGTGAIMAVPAHDTRDWEFAKKYAISIVEVVAGGKDVQETPFVDEGKVTNSDFLNGLGTDEAKEKMTTWLEEKKIGKRQVNYKLRDWVFSRQRYWGEPIPLVYCEACAKNKKFESKGEEANPGWIPLEEKSLPLELPKVDNYEPTDTGESPLAPMTKWVETKCPRCGGKAKRETDTMPNWAGSSWYFLRYADPHNDTAFASEKNLKYWMGVDWYNGGMEHVVLHLLYSRFWNIFLHDIGLVPTSEPYKKRTAHGMILASDGEKMSKSRGNVINPDEMVEKFGTDAFRTYIMFMGPFDQAVMWDTNGLVGTRRFLDRTWSLQEKVDKKYKDADRVVSLLHQTIKKVTEDIDTMRYNTAIAKMMELVNEASKEEKISVDFYATFLKLLSPFAPHLTEELWQEYGSGGDLAYSAWPAFDAKLVQSQTFTLPIQINGKVRDTVEVGAEITEAEVKELVMKNEKVQKWLEGKEPKKIIYIKGKLVSIVV